MTSTPGDVAGTQPEPALSTNHARHRFEATVGGSLAGFADYQESAGTLVFTHTEVDSAYEGQGVGSGLARYGLDEARRRHATVVPLCSFIAHWVERHPEYADLLASGPPDN